VEIRLLLPFAAAQRYIAWEKKRLALVLGAVIRELMVLAKAVLT
jgi:hypothetical protein